jgi:hypothetical protein
MTIAIALICLTGFVFVWRVESRNALRFTPSVVLMINELIRVIARVCLLVIFE